MSEEVSCLSSIKPLLGLIDNPRLHFLPPLSSPPLRSTLFSNYECVCVGGLLKMNKSIFILPAAAETGSVSPFFLNGCFNASTCGALFFYSWITWRLCRRPSVLHFVTSSPSPGSERGVCPPLQSLLIVPVENIVSFIIFGMVFAPIPTTPLLLPHRNQRSVFAQRLLHPQWDVCCWLILNVLWPPAEPIPPFFALISIFSALFLQFLCYPGLSLACDSVDQSINVSLLYISICL